jgi:hypothetical protein
LLLALLQVIADALQVADGRLSFRVGDLVGVHAQKAVTLGCADHLTQIGLAYREV